MTDEYWTPPVAPADPLPPREQPDMRGRRAEHADCPYCECCTAALCRRARVRQTPCLFACTPAAGTMDVSGCPCAPASLP